MDLKGKIAVIPTDTIYGIVGSALRPEVVEKIYKLRQRSSGKPMIILISSLNDLNHFHIKLTEKQQKFLEKIWPNTISVILPCNSNEFDYLHRGTYFLAFRMPKDEALMQILKQTGPLVAPSANIEGDKPSETIEEAKRYFPYGVDLYIDKGVLKSKPSTLIKLTPDGFEILREGSVSYDDIRKLLG